MTGLLTDTAGASELTSDSGVTALGLGMTIFTAVEACTWLWGLCAFRLHMAIRVVSHQVGSLGEKDEKREVMFGRQWKDEEEKMERKHLPLLTTVEASTAAATTSAAVTESSTSIVTSSKATSTSVSLFDCKIAASSAIPFATARVASVPRHAEVCSMN
jgi:hypothetical protein